MTLRTRLTAVFLAVVLGPVLIGAVFVGVTATKVNRQRSVERLDLAATAARTSVAALCRQLRTVAESVARQPTGTQVAAAARFVDGGLATAIHLEDAEGLAAATVPRDAPPPPWADCAGSGGIMRYEALAARVEMQDPAGVRLGSVYAAAALDAAMLRRLADATGAAVTLLGDASLSTETGQARADVAAVAGRLTPGTVREAGDERYVRREGPSADQPLAIALSVPRANLGELLTVLLAVVMLTAAGAVVAAWWLARSTTRPLVELARAADLVAGGDLAARVPVRGQDEVGRLATAFNRMTREMQEYVAALTASRDQLRGHLATLGDTLSSTHDLERILRVLLQTAMAATGARAGVVLLADPASGELVGRCGEGVTGIGQLRVPFGLGLVGGVAASRQARRGRVDRDGPPLAAAEPRCNTYVAVPFAGPARAAVTAEPAARQPREGGLWPRGLPPASGVLALYDRLGRDEFDDADLVTLRTFAGQAAVAVDNVRVHEEAQRLSVTDPLTGLLNYRSLDESLRREVERANRFGRTLGVLALDLDRFKEVNDSYGHAAGDAVLAEFARRVRGKIREVDLAFRQGGEEFVVLLPETDAAGAVVLAGRLGSVVRGAPIVVTVAGRRIELSVTVSVGVAVFPDHGTNGTAVLEAADDALYAAKAAGRDTFRMAERPTAADGTAAGPVSSGLRNAGSEATGATREDGTIQAPGPARAEASAGPSVGGVAGGPHPPRQSRGR